MKFPGQIPLDSGNCSATSCQLLLVPCQVLTKPCRGQRAERRRRKAGYLCPSSWATVKARGSPVSSLMLQLLWGWHIPATWDRPRVSQGLFIAAQMSFLGDWKQQHTHSKEGMKTAGTKGQHESERGQGSVCAEPAQGSCPGASPRCLPSPV